jgi:hypothetical protein
LAATTAAAKPRRLPARCSTLRPHRAPATAACAAARSAGPKARFVAVELAAATAAATGLANGELGLLAFGSVPGLAGKRRANQAPMDRPFVDATLAVVFLGFDVEIRVGIGIRLECLGVVIRQHLDWLELLVLILFEFFGHVGFTLLFGSGRTTTQATFELAAECIGLAPAGGGHPGVLVFVIGVARGAAGLLHLVLDHRYHRVIGNAALTRTVVVQNVTEPKPALLH